MRLERCDLCVTQLAEYSMCVTRVWKMNVDWLTVLPLVNACNIFMEHGVFFFHYLRVVVYLLSDHVAYHGCHCWSLHSYHVCSANILRSLPSVAAWVSGLPKGLGERRFFSLPSLPFPPQKRLILRLQASLLCHSGVCLDLLIPVVTASVMVDTAYRLRPRREYSWRTFKQGSSLLYSKPCSISVCTHGVHGIYLSHDASRSTATESSTNFKHAGGFARTPAME